MPDWFRRGVRFLVRPEQCVACGVLVDGDAIRESYVAFCSEECAMDWHAPQWWMLGVS